MILNGPCSCCELRRARWLAIIGRNCLPGDIPQTSNARRCPRSHVKDRTISQRHRRRRPQPRLQHTHRQTVGGSCRYSPEWLRRYGHCFEILSDRLPAAGLFPQRHVGRESRAECWNETNNSFHRYAHRQKNPPGRTCKSGSHGGRIQPDQSFQCRGREPTMGQWPQNHGSFRFASVPVCLETSLVIQARNPDNGRPRRIPGPFLSYDQD